MARVTELPYRRLIAWQRSYALAKEIMLISKSAPFQSHRDLQRQLTRAAMSVPANLAEGSGRGTPLDFAAFVDRARGSLFEVDTWLLAARDFELLDERTYGGLASRVLELNAIVKALRDRLRADSTSGERRTS